MHRPRLKRLLRISLRTVFVLTTLFCIWLGLKVRQVKQQREAIVWVEEHGGVVVAYDYELRYVETRQLPVPTGLTPPGPKWLHDLIGVDYFRTPIYVVVDYDDDIDDISPLANLTGLVDLHIGGKVVRDLSPLVKLQNLECLTLHRCEPQDLSPLLELTNLKALGLSTSVTVEEVTKLREALPACSVDWLTSH